MRTVLFTLAFLTLTTSVGVAATPVHDNAALRAVRFVDKSEGWAVGDHGVIWHTIDSGRTWERQPTGSKASLRGISMVTPYLGWVVGRIELPNAAGSIGVVLQTQDGGATWKEISTYPFSGLNAVQFLDENHGIAVGDGTDTSPTGAFRTTDGGKSWMTLNGPRVSTWRAVDCSRPDAALLCGDNGLAVLKGNTITRPGVIAGVTATSVARSIGDRLIVAGKAGEMRRLVDSAGSFEVCKPITTEAAKQCDFRGLSVVGDHIWAVCRPGSVVFHSTDFSQTWETQKTPITTPLNAVCMIDANTGWAVGEFGTILATTDGGKTWTMQKSAGQRAAVLFVHARGESVPLSTIAMLSHQDCYHTATLVVGHTDEFRLASAVRTIGGTSAEVDGSKHWAGYMTEPTPDRSPELLKSTRDPALLARLVLAIRMWRPEVIVTDLVAADSPTSDLLVMLHMKEAFTLAADATAFPEQLKTFGVEPHAAKKIYSVTAGADKATIAVDLTKFSPEVCESWNTFIEPASMILNKNLGTTGTACFRLVAHRLPGAEKHTALMQGIDLAEGGPSRWTRGELSPPKTLTFAEWERFAKLRQEMTALCLKPEAGGGLEKSLSQILSTLATLPDTIACRAALALGFRFTEQGQWTAARELFTFVVEKYSLQPGSVEASRWLIKYYTSGEIRRRLELGHQPIFQRAAFELIPGDAVQQASYTDALQTQPMYRFTSTDAFTSWNQVAIDLESQLAVAGSNYARDPANQLCLMTARRHIGRVGDNSRILKAMLATNPAEPRTDPWMGRLAEELRLANNEESENSHASRAVCRMTTTKPFLDGKLDESCWADASIVQLKPSAVMQPGYAATAKFLFDDKFLYIGVTCSHPSGKQVTKVDKRERDKDLNGHDRVEILLDLDRDYSTYYRLRVDHRGAVAEDCCGDATWNPRWFVAVDTTPSGWTAELAIPISELTSNPSLANQVWAMNVVRVIPGIGVDSWAGPTDTAPNPQTMGHLRFIGAKAVAQPAIIK